MSGAEWALAGDMSAWDSSWSTQLKELSGEVERKVMGESYMQLVDPGRRKTKKLISRAARIAVNGLHYTVPTNAQLNICIALTALKCLFNVSHEV